MVHLERRKAKDPRPSLSKRVFDSAESSHAFPLGISICEQKDAELAARARGPREKKRIKRELSENESNHEWP